MKAELITVNKEKIESVEVVEIPENWFDNCDPEELPFCIGSNQYIREVE